MIWQEKREHPEQPTGDFPPGIKPGSPCWEANGLTTTPARFPITERVVAERATAFFMFPSLLLIPTSHHLPRALCSGLLCSVRYYRCLLSTAIELISTRITALSRDECASLHSDYLTDPGYQKEIGEELEVSQGTFPSTINEIIQAKKFWQSKYRFPTSIGVIDCSHVGILKPSIHGDESINRKGKPTYNAQATCNDREMFTGVDLSWPGSVHLARI
ncbi:hypothetical protein PR048_026439 [Dryococelus australis]|uniref:Nuclease HARBI1 n=1 Tax=Dryococelus australis TaxID=614101 RepID=A0ABQ9GLB7_9NEOP|nr:hypothetical protein PR048_026439 [Dryococelus australis]